MSTKKRERAIVRLEIICDADTGHVFAARPAEVQAIGEDAPGKVWFEATENQVCEVIEISPEQALIGLPKLFATHKLRNGRLLPKKENPSRKKTHSKAH